MSPLLRPENRLLVIALVTHFPSEQLSNIAFPEQCGGVCCWSVWVGATGKIPLWFQGVGPLSEWDPRGFLCTDFSWCIHNFLPRSLFDTSGVLTLGEWFFKQAAFQGHTWHPSQATHSHYSWGGGGGGLAISGQGTFSPIASESMIFMFNWPKQVLFCKLQWVSSDEFS